MKSSGFWENQIKFRAVQSGATDKSLKTGSLRTTLLQKRTRCWRWHCQTSNLLFLDPDAITSPSTNTDEGTCIYSHIPSPLLLPRNNPCVLFSHHYLRRVQCIGTAWAICSVQATRQVGKVAGNFWTSIVTWWVIPQTERHLNDERIMHFKCPLYFTL